MEARRSNHVATDNGSAFPGAPPFPGTEVGEGPRAEQSGFAGTYCTTLLDWIQMVQLGRRDAVLTIRSRDGNEAMLWFQSGEIIDASCEGLTGSDAVYRIVAWQNGEVSLAFGSVDHDRRIRASTSGLLIEALARKDEADRDEEDTAVGAGLPAVRVETRRTLGGVLEAVYRALSPPKVASAVAAAFLLLLLGVLVARRGAPARVAGPISQPPRAAISVLPFHTQPSLPARVVETPPDRPSMTTVDARSLSARAHVGVAPPLVGVPPAKRKVSMKEARPVAHLSESVSPPKREGVNTSEGEGRRPSTSEVGTAVRHQPNVRLIIENPHPGIRLIGQPEARIDVVD